MKKEKVTERLESQKADKEAYYKYLNKCPQASQYKDLWADDIIALDYAIKKIKKDKSYMGSYWEGAWHMLLLVLLVRILEVIFNLL